MTPSELKRQVEEHEHDSHFFTHSTMKFFGDTMKNYGVRSATIVTHWNDKGEWVEKGNTVEVWELYRIHPVKHGLQASTYFSKDTFRRVYPVRV